MSLSAAAAVQQKVAQSVQVSVAAVSVTSYNGGGAPTVRTVDNSPAASQLTLYRDGTGTIFVARKDASGALLGVPRRLDRASQVFEAVAEGLATGAVEIGDEDNG